MRKKTAYFSILAILLLGISAKIDPAESNKNFDYSLEVMKMQSEFEKNVGFMVLAENYSEFILADAAKKILNIKENNQSQYFVYADRNPEKQIVLVCLFDSATKKTAIIGADKISTGTPERPGYFITPTGVFENSIANPSYRALGTKNQEGWRGFGVKNSRVWDFGWQETIKKNNEKMEIRLLMHATDPDFGEKRLGEVDSKGCVRISAKLNKFLDHYGILDKDYEANKHLKNISWVLAADREPTALAGKYLFIGDSRTAASYPENTENQELSLKNEKN